MNEQDVNYEGFFDGQNAIVPDNAELDVVVLDGFVGIEEGKSQQVCFINVSITTPGEFFGQKYKYNAKLFDMDANKRDMAMKNLGVLDAQAGFPLTNGQLELTTENISEHWGMKAEARMKMGLMIQETNMDGSPILDEHGQPTTRAINFVRGFAYSREKMRKSPAQQSATAQQPTAQQPTHQPIDDDIDF